jgi:hypothetical protein
MENRFGLKHGALKQMQNMRKEGNRYERFKMQKAAKGESVLLGKMNNTKKAMLLPLNILQQAVRFKLKNK